MSVMDSRSKGVGLILGAVALVLLALGIILALVGTRPGGVGAEGLRVSTAGAGGASQGGSEAVVSRAGTDRLLEGGPEGGARAVAATRPPAELVIELEPRGAGVDLYWGAGEGVMTFIDAGGGSYSGEVVGAACRVECPPEGLWPLKVASCVIGERQFTYPSLYIELDGVVHLDDPLVGRVALAVYEGIPSEYVTDPIVEGGVSLRQHHYLGAFGGNSQFKEIDVARSSFAFPYRVGINDDYRVFGGALFAQARVEPPRADGVPRILRLGEGGSVRLRFWSDAVYSEVLAFRLVPKGVVTASPAEADPLIVLAPGNWIKSGSEFYMDAGVSIRPGCEYVLAWADGSGSSGIEPRELGPFSHSDSAEIKLGFVPALSAVSGLELRFEDPLDPIMRESGFSLECQLTVLEDYLLLSGQDRKQEMTIRDHVEYGTFGTTVYWAFPGAIAPGQYQLRIPDIGYCSRLEIGGEGGSAYAEIPRIARVEFSANSPILIPRALEVSGDAWGFGESPGDEDGTSLSFPGCVRVSPLDTCLGSPLSVKAAVFDSERVVFYCAEGYYRVTDQSQRVDLLESPLSVRAPETHVSLTGSANEKILVNCSFVTSGEPAKFPWRGGTQSVRESTSPNGPSLPVQLVDMDLVGGAAGGLSFIAEGAGLYEVILKWPNELGESSGLVQTIEVHPSSGGPDASNSQDVVIPLPPH